MSRFELIQSGERPATESEVPPTESNEAHVARIRAALHVGGHDFNTVHQKLNQSEKQESESDKEFRTHFSPDMQKMVKNLAFVLIDGMTMGDLEKLAEEDEEFATQLGAINEKLSSDSLGTLIFAERIPMQDVKTALLSTKGDGAFYRYKSFVDEKTGADLADAFQESRVSGANIRNFLDDNKALERASLIARIERIGFSDPEEIDAQKRAVERAIDEDSEYRTDTVLGESVASLLNTNPEKIPNFFEEISLSNDPHLIKAAQQLKEQPYSISVAIDRSVLDIQDETKREVAKMDILKRLPREILVNDSTIKAQMSSAIADGKLNFASSVVEAAARKIFIDTGEWKDVQKFISDVSQANDILANESTRRVIVEYICADGVDAASRTQEMQQQFVLISKITDKPYYQHGMVNLVTTSGNPNFIAEHQQQIVDSLAKIDQWPQSVSNFAQMRLLQEPESHLSFGENSELVAAIDSFARDKRVPDGNIKSVIVQKLFKEKNSSSAREFTESVSGLYDRFKSREYTRVREKEEEYLLILATSGSREAIVAQTDQLDEVLDHLKPLYDKNKVPSIVTEYLKEFVQSSDKQSRDVIEQEGVQVGEAIDSIKNSSLASEVLFKAFKEGAIDIAGLKERALVINPLLQADKLTTEMVYSLAKNAAELKEVTPGAESQLLRMSIRELLADTTGERLQEVGYVLGVFDAETKQELRENTDQIAPAQLRQSLKSLLDCFAYSFTDDEEGAILKSKDSRELAKELFKKIPDSELDDFLPAAIEHALDVDFGDKLEAQKFALMSKDPNKRAEYEKMLTQAPESFTDRLVKFNERLHAVSSENAERDTKDLVDRHGQDVFDATFKEVKDSLAITINASFLSLEKILAGGRLKSCWEVNGAREDSSYRETRHNVERMLGIRSKGTQNDPHPVYGAVAAKEASTSTGAAPAYGETFIKLRSDKIKDRVSASYGDSFHHKGNPEKCHSQQYSFDDIAVARTRLELDKNEGYIEVQIQGFVTLDDIESVNIPLHAKRYADQLVAKYPDLIVNFV